MSTAVRDALGAVVSLRRYPVKSMMGEELNAVEVTDHGVLGDRAYALVDPTDGKVVSAKNPRKWGRLFDCMAQFVEPPRATAPPPPVRITLPDGSTLRSDQPDVNDRLSALLGRPVRLEAAPPPAPTLEALDPEGAGLPNPGRLTDVSMLASGTFFDGAFFHLVTTATLDRLRALAPRGRFEARRFRMNLVLEPPPDAVGFVEDGWVGKTLAVGDGVLLEVVSPCPRCVMTTLPQSDLPKDPGILRAAVEHNQGNVGVYASVARGGLIRRGDALSWG